MFVTSAAPRRLLARGFATAKKKETTAAKAQESPSITLPKLFAQKVAEYEHKDALRHVPGKIRWTYVELNKHTDVLGNVLIKQNMRPKSKVLLLLNNELEAVTTQLASIKAGAVPAYAGQGLNSQDIHSALKSVKPKLLLMHTKTTPVAEVDKLLPQLEHAHDPKDVEYPWQYPSLKHIWHVNRAQFNGMTDLEIVMKGQDKTNLIEDAAADEESLAAPSDQAVAFVHGDEVMEYSHQKLLEVSRDLAGKLQLDRNDRVGVVDSFSSVGAQAAFWASLENGAVTIVPALHFDAQEVLKQLHIEKCTAVVGTPEQVTQLTEAGLKEHVPSMQKALSVSADMKTQVHNL